MEKEQHEKLTGIQSSPQKKRRFISRVSKPISDYGWLPPWGLFTEKTINKFYENQKTKFIMKDKSAVYLCKVTDLSDMLKNNVFSWVIDNPGIFSS